MINIENPEGHDVVIPRVSPLSLTGHNIEELIVSSLYTKGL